MDFEGLVRSQGAKGVGTVAGLVVDEVGFGRTAVWYDSVFETAVVSAAEADWGLDIGVESEDGGGVVTDGGKTGSTGKAGRSDADMGSD